MTPASVSPWKLHLLLATGLFLLLSSLAHSFLGWPSIRPQLAAACVPDDRVGALAAGWHFGGLAMAAFGAIVLLTWRRARAGVVCAAGGLEAVGVVAAAYIVFGTAAFVLRSFAPFFLIFIVPGVALAACVWSRSRHPGGAPTEGSDRR